MLQNADGFLEALFRQKSLCAKLRFSSKNKQIMEQTLWWQKKNQKKKQNRGIVAIVYFSRKINHNNSAGESLEFSEP